MTRLAAISKHLYFPTPLVLAGDLGEHIATGYAMAGDHACRVLDVCAGDGAALVALTSAMKRNAKVDLYGIEIEQGRAIACAQTFAAAAAQDPSVVRFGSVIHAPFENTTARDFDLIFNNPPYALDHAEDKNGVRYERQEVTFLRRSAACLRSGGLIVWVVPEFVLEGRPWEDVGLRALTCWRFPAPHYEQFKQVVVLLQVASHTTYAHEMKIQEWPEIGSGKATIRCSVGPEPKLAKLRVDSALFGSVDSGVYATSAWRDATTARTIRGVQPPLQPLRRAHQALLLAAGAFDGQEVGGQLVRGVTRREKIVIHTDEEKITRHAIDTSFAMLDLKSGKLDTWSASKDREKINDWLKEHGDQLAERMVKQLPHTTPGLDGFTPKGKAPHDGTWFEAQAQTIAAGAHALRTYRTWLLGGEQGVGKTAIGSAVAHELGKVLVVLCPGHLVDKWASEYQDVTGRKSAVVESVEEVDALPDDIGCVVVSKERAKLGAPWRHVLGRRMVRPVFAEQEKKGRIVRQFLRAEKAPKSEETGTRIGFRACTSCGEKMPESGRDREACGACGAPAWTAERMSRKNDTPGRPTGKARWPIAHRLAQRFHRRFVLMMDEGHQYAAADTDQSQAATRLAAHAWAIICGTGTLWDGKASGLFFLIFRCLKAFRSSFKFDELEAFVKVHGTMETVEKLDLKTASYGGRRNTSATVREVPGIDPAVFRYLCHWSTFLRLRDLGTDALPPYEEEVRLIEPESWLRVKASKFLDDARTLRYEDASAAAKAFSDALAWPDCPEEFDGITAKEQALIDLCVSERAAGRGVVVYCAQVNRRPVIERLRSRLAQAGLKVEALRREDCTPRARGAHFDKLTKGGADVIITNGQLVETGLDLLWAVTIVQYGLEMSSKRFRQAVRRSWRIGQKNKVRVVIMAYAKTAQEKYTMLLAKKTKASAMLEDDVLNALASHASSEFDLLLATRQALGVDKAAA